jgi:hypothetical protein
MRFEMPAVIVLQDAKEGSNSSSQFENSEKETMSSKHAKTE